MEKCGRQKVSIKFFFRSETQHFSFQSPEPLPLAPTICMLWETAEKTWRRTFTLIVAVKRCGRFIITGKSVLYLKSSGKVKSK